MLQTRVSQLLANEAPEEGTHIQGLVVAAGTLGGAGMLDCAGLNIPSWSCFVEGLNGFGRHRDVGILLEAVPAPLWVQIQ